MTDIPMKQYKAGHDDPVEVFTTEDGQHWLFCVQVGFSSVNAVVPLTPGRGSPFVALCVGDDESGEELHRIYYRKPETCPWPIPGSVIFNGKFTSAIVAAGPSHDCDASSMFKDGVMVFSASATPLVTLYEVAKRAEARS